MTVTLRDIELAVRYGDAALAGESAGYLILGAADLCLLNHHYASLDSVLLSIEGVVQFDGSCCGEEESEGSLRHLLGRMLEQVRGSALNLRRIAERADRRGLRGLVQELEAALIPVNRRAAARTLARLVRETTKSAAQERTFARVEPVVPFADSLVEERSYTPESESLVAPAQSMAPVAQHVELPVEEPIVAPRAAPPSVDTRNVVVATTELPPSRRAYMHTGSSTRPAVLANVVQAYSSEHLARDLRTSSPSYEEPDVFLDDDFDEAPTQIFEGALAVDAPVFIDQSCPSKSVEEFRVGPQVESTKQYVARRGPSKLQFLHAVRRSKRSLEREESLIPLDRCVGARRPSEIDDLLNNMKVVEQSADELYLGLKNLARVDLSPIAPAVVEPPAQQSAC